MPWWARPRVVVAMIGAYCAVFTAIPGLLATALNNDDAPEAYVTQVLAWSYSPRNPPLYDWALYGVQQLADPSPLTFALVRYSFLFLFAWTTYAIARRLMVDPRLQALSVFSLSLVWVLGYHSHRILTHSNAMIVFIALSMLVLLMLRERATAVRYAALGACAALGMLSKFGYAGFLAAIATGAMFVAPYRRVLLDRRIAIAILVAGVPLAVFFLLGQRYQPRDYADAMMTIALPSQRNGVGATFVALASAWLGYVAPFLPAFLLIMWPWRARAADRGGLPSDDARLFIRNALITGTIIVCAGVFLGGNTNVRDRYFHAFYTLITVYAFAEVDRRRVDARRVVVFARTLVACAAGIALLFIMQRIAPNPRLCGLCTQSLPYSQFGRELRARFGSGPTLITGGLQSAGQLHMALPSARVVALGATALAPAGRAQPCILVWTDDDLKQGWDRLLDPVAANAGVRLADAERIALRRPAWLSPASAWTMDFYVLRIPGANPVCG